MKLLKFTASWCPPCQAMKKAKTLEKLAAKYDLELVIYDDDDKAGRKVADKYSVEALPRRCWWGFEARSSPASGRASLAMLEKAFARHLSKPHP